MKAPPTSRPWLFTPPPEPVGVWGAIKWWELRRIPYNLIVGGSGIVSLIIFFTCIEASGELKPGDDAVEPLALIAAPFLANICYTAGWLVDAPLRLLFPDLSSAFTTRLFRLGLGFSLFVVAFPALFWGGVRLLQLIHSGR